MTRHAHAEVDEDLVDAEPERSPVAEELAEWGAAIAEVWRPRTLEHQVGDRRRRRGPTAEVRTTSMNRKLSPVDLVIGDDGKLRPVPRAPFCSSTFASIDATCPDVCPFKHNGCMADGGYTRIVSKRLNKGAEGLGELAVIAEEAVRIDQAFGRGPIPQDGARGGRDLRIHVGGDVRTDQAARILARAAERWVARGGGSVWTFTHSWRTIPREAWGPIAALASCETAEDMRQALARGYAPAIVLDQLPADGRRFVPAGADVPVIPCPGETRAATCVGCRLCLDQPLAARGVGIAFGVHGRDKAAAAAALVQLGGPRR